MFNNNFSGNPYGFNGYQNFPNNYSPNMYNQNPYNMNSYPIQNQQFNPIQNMPQQINNNQANPIMNMMNMMNNMNSQQMFNYMLQNDRNFSNFIQSNKDKTLSDMLKELGINIG